MTYFRKQTVVDGIRVSTVRLDDRFGGGYETCLFGDMGSEVTQWYDTEEAAIAGHASWIAEVRNGRKVGL